MPYTDYIKTSELLDALNVFRGISAPDSISPATVADLLDKFRVALSKAAAAFGIPPEIAYATTTRIEHNPDGSLRLKYDYRNPDGTDGLVSVAIPEATTLKSGLMPAGDMKQLKALLRTLDDPSDGYQDVAALMEWFEQITKDRPEFVYGLRAEPGVDAIDIVSETMRLTEGSNYLDEMTSTLPAATAEKAGVMTAQDKTALDNLSGKLTGCTDDIDTLIAPGFYSLQSGIVLAVAADGGRKALPGGGAQYPVTQTKFGCAGIQSRTATVTKAGRETNVGEWSEWSNL